MSNVSHALRILSRELSVSVPRDDLPALMQAESDLKTRLARLRQAYSVHDETDLLAMCCLQYAIELQAEQATAASTRQQAADNVTEQLNSLDQEVRQALHGLGL